MRISYNPLLKKDGKTSVGALTSAPTGGDVTFDLPGRNIYARGVKFKGTDHTYTFSNDNNLTLTTKAAGDEGTNVEYGVNIQNVRKQLLNQWDISIDKGNYNLTTQWEDSGIDLSKLITGVYVIHINYEGVYFSGTFSLCSGTINTDDEIMMHSCGNTQLGRGRIFAKIAANSNNIARLYLCGNIAEESISKLSIKIKQIG